MQIQDPWVYVADDSYSSSATQNVAGHLSKVIYQCTVPM